MGAEIQTEADAVFTPPVRMPWITTLTALLLLFVFAGVVAIMLDYSKQNGGPSPDSLAGERQVQELRASEKDRLESYNYDAQTKLFSIPIEHAMNILIDEGKAKGQLQSFPTASKNKANPSGAAP